MHFAVAFDSLVAGTNDYGGMVDDWSEQFRTTAGYLHLRGGETVLAARLTGQHTQVIRARSTPNTRLVTADWRIRDTRSGLAFNIRDVEIGLDRLHIDFLCQTGVPIMAGDIVSISAASVDPPELIYSIPLNSQYFILLLF